MNLIQSTFYEQILLMKEKSIWEFNPHSETFNVAVVGGGRWGKILVRILSGIKGVSRIYFISNSNFQNVSHWIVSSSIKDNNFFKVIVEKNLDTVISNNSVKAVFVASMPANHYEDTKKLLLANKHVIVEKPFVPCTSKSLELVTLAKKNNLTLAVGLEFFCSSYLYNFRTIVESKGFREKKVSIVWQDVFKEDRHGILKLPDMTVNVFKDLFPHILSILQVLFNLRESVIKTTLIEDGGDTCLIELEYGKLPISIKLSRKAVIPQRRIEVVDHNNQYFSLDFTNEPGIVNFNGKELPEDPHWKELPGPLNLEINFFLRKICDPKIVFPFLAENTISFVKTIEEGNEMIMNEQAMLIRDFLFENYPTKPSKDVIIALRDHLLPGFLGVYLVKNPKDESKINYWLEKAFLLIHKFSYHPFSTQREILKELNIKKDELIKLNTVVRKSEFTQLLILRHGHGMKYWENTITPLVQANVVQAAINNEYHFPHRVGVYVGRSCMFFCFFCGRNPKAKYKSSVIEPGNILLKQMFMDAPKNDPYRFYISGGLEPLTNPEIGEVVNYGSEQGFKLSMYTNGFMLTPDLLKRQPGLWDLDTLRISLYGVDDESYFNVTQNKKAFHKIIKNVKDFLRLREELNSQINFGFNFVVLPDCAEQLTELVEIIAEINTESSTDRQVDFLTLREDYSYVEDGASRLAKHDKLMKVFEKLEIRRRKADLRDLYIDYGYALYGTTVGKLSPPLHMVESHEMRPQGYPQISVVIDLLGDVYLYREAGFLDRPGASRYIIGRVSESKSLKTVIREFIESGRKFPFENGDTKFFDAFDHLVTGLLNQAEDDTDFGIPFNLGPVNDRIFEKGKVHHITVAHPTIAHPTLPQVVDNSAK